MRERGSAGWLPGTGPRGGWGTWHTQYPPRARPGQGWDQECSLGAPSLCPPPLRPWLDPVQAQVTGHVSLRGEVGGGTCSPLLCSSSAPKLPVALSPGLTSLFPVQG